MLKVIGFYTDDPLYSSHAKLMQASLQRFGVEPYLEAVNADEWQKIIAFKPEFIQRACQKFPDEPVLYIDADAFVHKDIRVDFADIKDDIAVHYFEDKELASGTLFINSTPAARSLIDEWVSKMRQTPELWDQKVLEDLVKEWEGQEKLSVKKLGPEYTYIFDLTPKRYSNENLGKPIIEHLQASRESRFDRELEKASYFKKFFMQTKLNKKYRKILFRRYHTKNLAKSIGENVDF